MKDNAHVEASWTGEALRSLRMLCGPLSGKVNEDDLSIWMNVAYGVGDSPHVFKLPMYKHNDTFPLGYTKRADDLSCIALPFPAIALELRAKRVGHLGSRRVVIAWEIDANQKATALPRTPAEAWPLIGITVCIVADDGRWYPPAFIYWTAGNDGLVTCADFAAKVMGIKPDESHDRIIREFWSEIRALFDLLHALSNEHVTTKLVEAPAKLQKKRARNGGAPIFDYWILDIHSHRVIRSGYAGGTHASPRMHERRAHDRRLPNGHLIRVRACKVGDISLGAIFKDYRVFTDRNAP